MTSFNFPISVKSLQRARGKGRNQWVIRAYLDSKGLNMSDLADKAQVHHHIVGETLRGLRNHGRVLKELERLGCPKEILYPLEYKEVA